MENKFSKFVNFNFSEFIDFMSEWRDFWDHEDPFLDVNKISEYDDSIDFEKSNLFCNFANNIFYLFKEKINSFNKDWVLIESSQSPFHFSLGKGIYSIILAARSDDCKGWDFIEFVCDY